MIEWRAEIIEYQYFIWRLLSSSISFGIVAFSVSQLSTSISSNFKGVFGWRV